MRILFIGDIVASPGRHIVEQHLPRLLEEYRIDFTIANGENSAGGFGMNRRAREELVNIGVDAFTMGNHVWDNREIFQFIDHDERIVRPANIKPGLPGAGWRYFTLPDGQKLALVNLVGQVFMPPADCPYAAMDAILRQIGQETPLIIVDMHGEATSEKFSLGWYLDGRISALFGTHTHIQTNDARILPRGTAYLTDAGMTGPRDSVLGVDKEIIVNKMRTQMPHRFEPARGDLQFNGVVVELNERGRSTAIELINFWEPAL